MFYYKDKGTKWIAHMLDFQEYGVTKKWVIISEISKEVENNNISDWETVVMSAKPTKCGKGSVREGEAGKKAKVTQDVGCKSVSEKSQTT